MKIDWNEIDNALKYYQINDIDYKNKCCKCVEDINSIDNFNDKAEEIYNKLTEPKLLVKDIFELEQALVGRRDCTIYITNGVDIKLNELSWKDTVTFNKIQSNLMDRNITLKIYNRR